MSDIQTCLANFAIGAWANDEDALTRSQEAIDDYLAGFGRDPAAERAALRELLDAYNALKLDSRVATAICGDLALRIGALA